MMLCGFLDGYVQTQSQLKMLDRSIYDFFDACSPFLIIWLTVFIAATTLKLTVRWCGRDIHWFDGLIGSELPGLPLTLLHSVCFVKAILIQDWISVLLFAWWGPGFVIVASWYLYCKKKKISFDWSPYARTTSISCKLIYLTLMALFFRHGLPTIPFVFSLWIMHDQVRLSWFQNNADRTRRLCEDFWVVRLGYALFLFVPWFADTPYHVLSMVLGPVIALLWISGLRHVVRAGHFFRTPADPTANLRDIVYIREQQTADVSDNMPGDG